MTDASDDSTPAVVTDGFTKRFGSVTAVDGLELTVPAGSVYGLLGPNGAGKSTTIDALVGLVHATEGTVRVLGMDVRTSPVKIRRRTGILPDGFTPYERLTGREHLNAAARANRVTIDTDEALARVGLADAADRTAGGYSHGMTQRLGLAMALVGAPDLLVLDEPAAGLDPHGIELLRRIVREEHARGATVMLSTHQLAQVEAVCDTVGIIDDGRLVAEDSAETLRRTVETEATLRVRPTGSIDRARELLRDLNSVTGVTADDGVLIVQCDAEQETASVIAALERSDVALESYEKSLPGLEQVFEAYTDEQ
ncbi:ABC transporter ATP-binding protein [Halobacterium sp. KA-4]|uniref:ABC transporter ATP-binding protein n=1 Tax=Halobacterium sp. KA-4 TaxID=2896367 RepID=UPI001E56ABF7|nr:ABC transporter ATP-binding protein [Halobacterium sp. KA-4]MCD2201336.1 ABC transporter ATP-binding protein [Halobacterium sp. KA-4]